MTVSTEVEDIAGNLQLITGTISNPFKEVIGDEENGGTRLGTLDVCYGSGSTVEITANNGNGFYQFIWDLYDEDDAGMLLLKKFPSKDTAIGEDYSTSIRCGIHSSFTVCVA